MDRGSKSRQPQSGKQYHEGSEFCQEVCSPRHPAPKRVSILTTSGLYSTIDLMLPHLGPHTLWSLPNFFLHTSRPGHAWQLWHERLASSEW